EREILGRDHRIRGTQLVVAQLDPRFTNRLGERLQPCPERALVARLDRLGHRVVELVQPLAERVVDAVLALAEKADDHFASSASPSISLGAAPEPSSAFIFSSSESTWPPWEICAS